MARTLSCVLCAAAFLAISAASAPAAEWRTFGFDNQRSGHNPRERVIGPATAPRLRRVWTARLRGPIDTQPTAATVRLGRRLTALVFAGTEHGYVYALRASDGRVVWRRFLAMVRNDCDTSLDGRYGVSGTPYLDTRRRRLFVVATDGNLHALDMATGRTLPGWPLRLTSNSSREHAWSAVNLVGNRLYATIGSYCDRPGYRGAALLVDVRGPRIERRWLTTGEGGPSGGGIWGWGGMALDPESGDLFAASANALAPDTASGYAERVLRFGPDLKLKDSHHPGRPSGSAFGNDFGTTPLLFHAPGCPPQLAAQQKSGALWVYDRNRLGAGPVQRLQVSDQRLVLFIGMPAYQPRSRTVYVANPARSSSGLFRHGMVALRLGTDCRLRLRWQRRAGVDRNLVSPPTVANGVVLYGAAEALHAFDSRTGRRLWTSGPLMRGPIFAPPAVVNGRVLAASWDGRVYAFAPR